MSRAQAITLAAATATLCTLAYVACRLLNRAADWLAQSIGGGA